MALGMALAAPIDFTRPYVLFATGDTPLEGEEYFVECMRFHGTTPEQRVDREHRDRRIFGIVLERTAADELTLDQSFFFVSPTLLGKIAVGLDFFNEDHISAHFLKMLKHLEERGRDDSFTQCFVTRDRFYELTVFLEYYSFLADQGRQTFLLKHDRLHDKYFFRQVLITEVTHAELVEFRQAIYREE